MQLENYSLVKEYSGYKYQSLAPGHVMSNESLSEKKFKKKSWQHTNTPEMIWPQIRDGFKCSVFTFTSFSALHKGQV